MKHYDIVYELGVNNNGVVTSWEAREAGISTSELSRFCRDGRLEHVGRGVYRLTHFVPTRYSPYAEAVALVGRNAFLYGESVIAMFGLAPTNPRYICVATSERVRRTLPSWLHVVQEFDMQGSADYEGVRSQSLCDAIASATSYMMPERLLTAAYEARAQGLITGRQFRNLTEILEAL